MAASLYTLRKQITNIQVLIFECEIAVDIHLWVVTICTDATRNVSTVSRFVSKVNCNLRGKVRTDLYDRYDSGSPVAAFNVVKAKKMYALITY